MFELVRGGELHGGGAKPAAGRRAVPRPPLRAFACHGDHRHPHQACRLCSLARPLGGQRRWNGGLRHRRGGRRGRGRAPPPSYVMGERRFGHRPLCLWPVQPQTGPRHGGLLADGCGRRGRGREAGDGRGHGYEVVAIAEIADVPSEGKAQDGPGCCGGRSGADDDARAAGVGEGRRL
uniref:Uncharacterized protein n=1 Tax=Arundo donax TaxID=35708 RepID=A0A0A9E1E8_ARUDO